jgi:hypothetical protein
LAEEGTDHRQKIIAGIRGSKRSSAPLSPIGRTRLPASSAPPTKSPDSASERPISASHFTWPAISMAKSDIGRN